MNDRDAARPRFSVLIPSYNSGAYLATTLESVRKQGRGDVEVIVMDGGSTDATAAVVAGFADLALRFVSEPDRGQLDAVQKAARLARGDILYWLNADDVLLPGSFDAVDRVFMAEPAVDLIFSDDFAFDEQRHRLVVGGLIKGLSYRDHSLFYRQMYSECIFWRRERTRYLPDSDYDLRIATDYAFFINLRRGLTERWLAKRLGAFRIVTGQMSAREQAKLATEQARVRADACRRMGWSPSSIGRRRALHAPSFYLRQVLRPRAHALARRIGRFVDGGARRRRMTDAFFDDWLRPGAPVTPALTKVLHR